MPVPFPTDETVNLQPPSYDETATNAAGVLSATRTADGNTDFQRLLIEATFESMTGHRVDTSNLPFVDSHQNARNLANRAEMFRMRMVHMMVLTALVLRPIPPAVAEQVAAYSRELGIDDRLLDTVAQFAQSDRALAAVDFERNGYTADWTDDRSAALHSQAAGWDADEHDHELAARWGALADLAPGTLGRGVHDFYQARGFAFPGTPGSAPPLLAQHDWVHVLADYGTKVEAELEVFAFIARANDDPRGFSLLAMVISLFETGYLAEGAGLFEAFPGQLSQAGMTTRIGDAMRRGALSHGLHGEPDVDFMAVDWFELADQRVDELRARFNLTRKAAAAVDAGSVGPWEPGGISPAQLAMGRGHAERLGIEYDSFGATVDRA
ncbi:MAG: hypothetical protein QNJ12_02720 [Ilumatobacter sp.]|uniref:hypothetical protein n=1 Tax=Ilumatobacter sp. TaxID=1967498 RepID=UPI0026130E15|nr:hypothetical protein [Ilumatobacter sp.]MDJ0767672.1 hypothetical protein [Ilumatobacter sp.]